MVRKNTRNGATGCERIFRGLLELAGCASSDIIYDVHWFEVRIYILLLCNALLYLGMQIHGKNRNIGEKDKLD